MELGRVTTELKPPISPVNAISEDKGHKSDETRFWRKQNGKKYITIPKFYTF